MNTMELLTEYRELLLEMEELEFQLERALPTGKPSQARSVCPGEQIGGQLDNLSAALQLADGLEALIQQKRAALAELAPQVGQVLAGITSGRTLQIIQRYYLQGMMDRQIAPMLHLSTSRVNQLRLAFLQQAK